MRPRPAFVLLPLLVLVALFLAVTLLCLSAGSVAGAASSAAIRQARGRLSALAAARIGVGELAQLLGPDRRISGVGADGRSWSARKTDEGWQRVPIEGSLRDSRTGRLTWSSCDLSTRCDLASPVLARERAPSVAMQPRMRQRLAAMLPRDADVPVLAAARVGDLPYLGASLPAEIPLSACVAGSRSLLIDPSEGGWRENLSVPSVLSGLTGEPLALALLSPAATLREQPARGMEPTDVAGAPARLRHMPVLAEIALSVGVFNARSDGRHRVRLHAQMALWNPSALPLLSVSDKRMFLAEVEGAPELTVTNLDSGASFSTWLDRCPPGVFWGYTQGVRERGLWWWVEVLDTARHGMLRSGILPGEVYSLLMPDPSAQPYGLSRVVGRETWRYDDGPHPPGWVRPSPETFLPGDRIAIAMRFVTPGTTVRLHPYVGTLDAATEAAAYGSPATVALRHIPWPDARLELSGAEYSRVDSNGYVLAERRFRWAARLVACSESDVFALAADPVAMGSDIDLADPFQIARWDVTADPVADAQKPPAEFSTPAQGVLWDAVVNRHEATADGAFADWRVREVPVDPPLDVASLRHLHGMSATTWLPLLDKAFFSAPESPSSPRSENPRLSPWGSMAQAETPALQAEQLAGPDAAAAFSLDGAFNVNTSDARAWEAFLRSAPARWRADVGGPAPPGELDAEAVFFAHPTGAHLAKFASWLRCDVDDESMGLLADPDRFALSRRQSVRAPAPDRLRSFCDLLALEIGRRADPFAGVADFLRSGVLERAIALSGLNEGLPSGSPLSLRPLDIFGGHLALMVARGDTFAVMGVAQVDGVTLALEFTVQRVPAPAALPHLGRRFIVTKARWLDAPSR